MHTRTRITVICLILASPIAMAKSALEDARLVTGVSLGYSQFSFPEKLDQEISFSSITVPVVIAINKWQLSTNLQTTLSDASISEEEDVGKASRDDLDLTLGYSLSSHWTIFAGYKYGKTAIQFTPRDADEEEESEEGSDDEGEGEIPASTKESYQQKGPFIGVSYNYQFERAGNLSFTVAYADLDATNDFTANTDEEEFDEDEIEFDDITGRVNGATQGFSYSLSWSMPLSSNLVFQTRFKVNDYKQDIVFNNVKFSDIDERFTSLHVGLAYVF